MRVALITGGMGGLGESISTKMHTAGYRVVVTHSPGNTRVKDWLAEQVSGRTPVQCLRGRRCRFRLMQGGHRARSKDIGPIDILVNNAGITKDTTFKKMSKADWDAVIRTNLDSVFNMTKQVMDGMTDRGWGRVINVSWSMARRVHSGRPTIRPPRPACTASPRPWPWRWRARA